MPMHIGVKKGKKIMVKKGEAVASSPMKDIDDDKKKKPPTKKTK